MAKNQEYDICAGCEKQESECSDCCGENVIIKRDIHEIPGQEYPVRGKVVSLRRYREQNR